MATIDEILAAMGEIAANEAVDEVLVIDANTRQINVPGSELIFGVVADAQSERKYFYCPRYVGNNLDMSVAFIRVNYRNANGQIDSHIVDDVALTADGKAVTFSWEIAPKAVAYKGLVTFLVDACFVGPSGMVLNRWHTAQATGNVLDGLIPTDTDVTAGTRDVVAQLVNMVENQTLAVENAGAAQTVAVEAAAKAAESAAVAEIEAKGTNTLASIPNDYTAIQSAVDALAKNTAPGIVCSAAGTSVVVTDASDQALAGLRIFGRSTQDGTPTPETPVAIKSVENPTVTVDGQTLELTHTLPGIPVSSDGNYTDSDGQQWICDEIDLARGVYVQRVGELIFTGDESWSKSQYYENTVQKSRSGLESGSAYLCNMYAENTLNVNHGVVIGGAINVRDDVYAVDVDTWKTHLKELYAAGTPVIVVGVLTSPIETPLTEAEIAAYRDLHTNKPNTTVLNDAGAWMSVDYVADTKLYIDHKIAALVGSV